MSATLVPSTMPKMVEDLSVCIERRVGNYPHSNIFFSKIQKMNNNLKQEIKITLNIIILRRHSRYEEDIFIEKKRKLEKSFAFYSSSHIIFLFSSRTHELVFPREAFLCLSLLILSHLVMVRPCKRNITK